MREKYQQITVKYEAQITQDSKTFNTVGYAKLAAVLALVVCAVFLFASGLAVLAVLAFVAVLATATLLWIWHYRLDNRLRYAKGMVAVCTRHIARVTGEWTHFEDCGQEFVDLAHPYACDLDIVGSKSVFQFLNTTHTWHGRQTFAADLLNHNTPPSIKERQQAIAELSRDINFTNDIEYHLSKIGKSPLNAALAEELANNSTFVKSVVVKFLMCYVPVAAVVLLLAGFLLSPPLLFTGLVIAVLQPFVFAYFGSPIKYLGSMARLPYKLNKYVKVIDIITSRNFDSPLLNDIKSRLAVASGAIRELEKIDNKLSVRANPMIYITLGWLLLWDFHCALLFERWRARHSSHAAQWFSAIGEFESLMAFSHLPNVCANVCLPRITDTGKILNAKNLGHPLLSNSSRVCNDVTFDNNIFIISGSNMSGKTTFMRTVGVNLLLAKLGSFVCAQEMTCSYFDIVTSMRNMDDLNAGVSSFYAELTRVKLVLDTCKKPSVLFLIDEIFKGTNSVDRLAGADAVISKLSKIDAVGMVSTHDLELCELADIHERIVNHSFCEYYQSGKIHFDYKMRVGKSQTTNARFLMEMVGL